MEKKDENYRILSETTQHCIEMTLIKCWILKKSTQVPYLVKMHFKNEEEIISLETKEWMYSYIPTLQEMLKDIL